MKAFIFAGQGSQKEGMGLDLYQKSKEARVLFNQADEILGYKFTDIMFNASEGILMDTRNTQLALFIYEVVVALSQHEIEPQVLAGHSLGEYSALVVSNCITFEDGINLIKDRGQILYDAYQSKPSAMGAVIGLSDGIVENLLADLRKEYNQEVYVANYNGPGQLVIAGSKILIKDACKRFVNLGAKKSFPLPMKAIGHTPLCEQEALLLSECIEKINFQKPKYPIYQCVDGLPHTDVEVIKNNLKKHIVQPVQWTSIVNNMVKDSVNSFYEVGTDDTLQKIIQRMYPNKYITSIWSIPTYNNITPFKLENYEIK